MIILSLILGTFILIGIILIGYVALIIAYTIVMLIAVGIKAIITKQSYSSVYQEAVDKREAKKNK